MVRPDRKVAQMNNRVASGLLPLLLVMSALVLAPSPARADAGNPFDVYSLRSVGLHVNSGSCRNVRVYASTNAAPDFQDISAEVDVWRGGTYLGTASLSGSGRSGLLAGSYFYCPSLDDVGSFRLGDSEVSWEQYDDDFNYYNSGDFIDRSRGRMVVKQATRISITGRRTGMTRSFKVGGAYFPAGADHWYRFPAGSAMRLQARPVGSQGAWKFVKAGKTNKLGQATLRVKRSGKYTYRVVSSATSRSWGGVSRALTR